MQHRRRIAGYATPEEMAADCLFETQGKVAEASRSGRLSPGRANTACGSGTFLEGWAT
jgi:hypothetical protein